MSSHSTNNRLYHIVAATLVVTSFALGASAMAADFRWVGDISDDSIDNDNWRNANVATAVLPDTDDRFWLDTFNGAWQSDMVIGTGDNHDVDGFNLNTAAGIVRMQDGTLDVGGHPTYNNYGFNVAQGKFIQTGGRVDVNEYTTRVGDSADALLEIRGGIFDSAPSIYQGGSSAGLIRIVGSNQTVTTDTWFQMDNGNLEFVMDALGFNAVQAATDVRLGLTSLSFDFSALSTTIGDIMLIDNQGGTSIDPFGGRYLDPFNVGDTVHTFGDGSFYWISDIGGTGNDLVLVEDRSNVSSGSAPEPSTLLLAVLSLVGLAMSRRGRSFTRDAGR